uniref:Uncharacterized protein n=1 Tax=Glossina palpalis gambiensis TaxID=67801 RepID=A0A1B0BV55_9MUSC
MERKSEDIIVGQGPILYDGIGIRDSDEQPGEHAFSTTDPICPNKHSSSFCKRHSDPKDSPPIPFATKYSRCYVLPKFHIHVILANSFLTEVEEKLYPVPDDGEKIIDLMWTLNEEALSKLEAELSLGCLLYAMCFSHCPFDPVYEKGDSIALAVLSGNINIPDENIYSQVSSNFHSGSSSIL